MEKTLVETSACDGLKSLLFGMVISLVDAPEDVTVDGVDDDGCVVLHVMVAPGDVGKIIGKQGRMARALRCILSGAAITAGVRYELNIVNQAGREGAL